MRKLLISSLVLSILAISGLVLIHPQQASAIPLHYNQSSLNIPFTTFTKNATSTSSTMLIDAGYNGTINSIYEGHAENNILYYKLGDHPTLPMTLDATNNMTASASTAATQTLTVTVPTGNNNNVLVVAVSFVHIPDKNHNNARISSITDAGANFGNIVNKTVTCTSAACDSEFWFLYNPPTGLNTITITPANTGTYHMIAGVYAFHNVRGLAPVARSNSTSSTSVTPSVNLTPAYAGNSWLIDNVLSNQTSSPSASTNTKAWIGKTALVMGASQYNNNPIIKSTNILSYTTTNVQWVDSAIELVPIQNQNNFNFYLSLQPPNNPVLKAMVANGSNVYYVGSSSSTNLPVNHINVLTGVETHDFTMGAAVGGTNSGLFLTSNHVWSWILGTGGTINYLSNKSVNSSLGTTGSLPVYNNAVLQLSTTLGISQVNYTNTSTSTESSQSAWGGAGCSFVYTPSVTFTPINSFSCDTAIPNHATRYWNGMLLSGINAYAINSTLQFTGSIISNTYEKPLSIPSSIYGIQDPDLRMIGHWSGKDQLISYTTSTIQYTPLPALMSNLNSVAVNRAFQSYYLTLVGTDSNYALSPSTSNPVEPIKLYGPNLNVTTSKYGVITLPSGYTMKTTSTESAIRTVDPQWTNQAATTIYPAITTQGSLYQVFLTVSNAPSDAAVMIESQSQAISGNYGVYAVAQLDATRSVEFDIPPDTCVNVYVSDISKTSIWNYEGALCASGVNQKSIAYTTTLPFTFYTMQTGVTDSYTPSTNALSTTVRSSTAGLTYTVTITNSTGAIAQQNTFTMSANQTLDTRNFNVSSVSKPASLAVSVAGTTIYSAYLGSSLSLASTMSFFHQYFNYQGFDMLSFIPIIFASMFTRNTVGIGMALTVVVIASLSFLSVVVVPDQVVYISIFIAIIGMIGYRGLYG